MFLPTNFICFICRQTDVDNVNYVQTLSLWKNAELSLVWLNLLYICAEACRHHVFHGKILLETDKSQKNRQVFFRAAK